MPFVSERFIKVREEKKDAATTGNDLYLNPSGLSDGQTVRFSPVGDVSLDFYEIWGRTDEKQPKARSLRFADEPTTAELNQRAEDEGILLIDNKGNPSKIKQALAFWIWNYGTESVQLFQASQATILDTLGSLFADPDVAENPSAWDFELNRTGTTYETTRYTVVLKPGRRKGAVGSQVNDAWEECRKAGYNLEALLTGGDPTKMPF